jgi:hypothetical protein
MQQIVSKDLFHIIHDFLKILSRPVSRDLITTIALDSIGLLDIKSITYSTFSKISIGWP